MSDVTLTGEGKFLLVEFLDAAKASFLVDYNQILIDNSAEEIQFSGPLGAKLSFKAADAGYANWAAMKTDILARAAMSQNVGGFTNIVGVEVTRPADTNAYAALDVISNSTTAPVVITFTNLAKIANGSGYLTKFRAMTDKKDFAARIRLHLYNSAPIAVNDNAAFGLLYANKDKRIGHIDLAAFTTEDATASTSARSQNYDVRMAFNCTGGSKDIYAIAEILDAATPASGQKFYFELTAENNG